jgi:chitodextrinase
MKMTKIKAKEFIDSLLKLRTSAVDEQAIEAPAVYPAWKAEVKYATGDRVLYEDVLYKILQDHTSQETWTPIDSPSLFAKVLIPDKNVIPEWEQPDSTNPYMKGDKVTYEGKTWESNTDNNVWAPGTYGWEEII